MNQNEFDRIDGNEGIDNTGDQIENQVEMSIDENNSDNTDALENSFVDKDDEIKDATFREQNSFGGFSEQWKYEKYERRSKKRGRGAKVLAGVMSFLFVATASAFVTYYVTSQKSETSSKSGAFETFKPNKDKEEGNILDKITSSAVTEIPEINSSYTGEELTSQEIIATAKPSVVGIRTMVENYYSFYGTQTSEGVGSGFIITEDGYIVTNYHVIEDAIKITVVLADGTEMDADVVGYDALSDVAVLKVEPEGKLPALVIGNSDAVVAGDTVIAIGCPSGIDLAGTATRGMVSMTDREISITDYYGRIQKKMSVIQIDAAINPGNSGGPLLNSRGEVIGINTLKLSSTSYEGIGFALPINGVMALVDQICENGAVVERPTDSFVSGKAALGITYREITAAESKKHELPQGVLVVLMSKNGAASNAGIKIGDIIVEFDGKEITTDDELISLIDTKKPGDKVKVVVYRDGEDVEVEVIMSEASE